MTHLMIPKKGHIHINIIFLCSLLEPLADMIFLCVHSKVFLHNNNKFHNDVYGANECEVSAGV